MTWILLNSPGGALNKASLELAPNVYNPLSLTLGAFTTVLTDGYDIRKATWYVVDDHRVFDEPERIEQDASRSGLTSE